MATGSDSINGMVNILNTHFGMRLSRQDVENPSKDLLPNVFVAVYCDVGMNETAMEQMAFSDYIPRDVDAFSASVYAVHLLKLMRAVFFSLGVANVSMADLQRPQPKRVRKLIGVLVDNWMTQRSVLTRYDEKQRQHLEAREETELLKAKLDIAKTRVNELLVHPGCSAEQKARAQSEWKRLAEEHEAKRNAGTAKDKEYRDLKHELTKATSHLDALTHATEELSLALQEARRAAAVSPARMRRETEAGAEELSRLRREAAEEARKTAAARERHEGVGRTVAVLAEHRETLRATLKNVRARRDATERFRRAHAERVDVEAEKRGGQKTLEERREERSNRKAWMATKCAALQSKLKTQRQQNAEISKKLRETKGGEARLTEDLKIREAALQRELAHHEAAAAEYEAAARRIVRETEAGIRARVELRRRCEERFLEQGRKIVAEASGDDRVV